MPRYKNSRILTNSSKYYAPLRKSRNMRAIRHYETPILYNPDAIDRFNTTTEAHIWSYGDRFYKLADQYYGDVRFWWVIAWYNGTPTEADINNGDLIEIPLNIQEALRVLGA